MSLRNLFCSSPLGVTLKPFLICPRNVSGLLEPTLKQQSGIKKTLAWPGMAIHSVSHFGVNNFDPKTNLNCNAAESALRMLRMKCKLKVWNLNPGKNLFYIKIETIFYL